MAKKKATKKPATEQAVVPHEENLPVAMSFEDDAGGGMENIDQDSVAIPYIKLLQPLSPEVDEEDELYIDGAKPGMFYHTISEKLYETITVVPAYFERVFNEWADRETGGGFKGRASIAEFKAQPTERDDTGKYWREGGDTYFADTRNHYVLFLDPDTGEVDAAIVSLSSTALKTSRKWMSVQQGLKFPKASGSGSYTPPSYSHKYEVTSGSAENAKGKWKTWQINILGVLSGDEEHIYTKAKEFAQLIESGAVRAADPAAEAGDDDNPDM